jgi:hypothetical protein
VKRLMKKAAITLYHATTLSNLRSIAQSGKIEPQAGSGVGLVNTVEFSKDDLQNLQDNNFQLDTNEMFNDDNADESRKQNYSGFVFLSTEEWAAEQYANTIWESPENPSVLLEITGINESDLLPDDVDDPEAKTWQDSAGSIQQVKVGDSVEFSKVSSISLLNKYGTTVAHAERNDFEKVYQEYYEQGEFNVSDSSSPFDDWDDEDDDSGYDYEDMQKYNERKQALEEDLSKYKADVKNGIYRVFDTPVEEVAKIFEKHEFLNQPMEDEEGEVVEQDYIEVNVDRNGEVFVTPYLYESFSPSPVVFKSTDGGKTFTLEADNTSSLSNKDIQDSLRKILGNKSFTYNGQSYTLDKLFNGSKVESRLKKNFSRNGQH